MDYLFLKICFICSCWAIFFIDELTANRGLLDFFPQYYPKWLQKPLSCPICLSGWLSMAIILVYCNTFLSWVLVYQFAAPATTFVMVKVLYRITEK